MCFSKARFLVLALALTAVSVAAAESPILTTPRKPFAFSGGYPISPDDKVWSAVVLASNPKKGERPSAVVPELAPYVSKLSDFFGYNQFEVLGSATKVMDEKCERWLVPTQNFWVCAKAHKEAGGYRLNLEFFHDKRSLLKTEAMLCPKSPVIIRGPMHVRGQILMVFEIKP